MCALICDPRSSITGMMGSRESQSVLIQLRDKNYLTGPACTGGVYPQFPEIVVDCGQTLLDQSNNHHKAEDSHNLTTNIARDINFFYLKFSFHVIFWNISSASWILIETKINIYVINLSLINN